MDKQIHAPVEANANAAKEHVIVERPKETKLRSIVKTVAYRFAGSSATALQADLLVNLHAHVTHANVSFNQDMTYGAVAFVADAVIKLGLMYGSERTWAHISWGYTHNNGEEPAFISKFRKGFTSIKGLIRKMPKDDVLKM